MGHRMQNQTKHALAAGQQTFFLPGKNISIWIQAEKSEKLQNEFFGEDIYIYHDFFSLSSYAPSLFFPIYDQVDDKLDRCTIQRPSFTQQFFSGSNIWCYSSVPLGNSAAMDMAGCLAYLPAVELYLKLLLDISLHPSTASLSPFTWGWPQRSQGKILHSPDWCSPLGWVTSHKPKGHQFNSWSEHMPGLKARSPIGAMLEATNQYFFSSPSPSCPLSLKINK